jgi:hypothetical protein
MSSDHLGQKIAFSIVYDEDQKYTDYVVYKTKVNDTVKKICAARKVPRMADEVARLNKIANTNSVLRHPRKKSARTHKWIKYPKDRKTIKLPGTMRQSERFEAHADFGGRAPRIEAGYAKIEPVDRPGRTGISHFTGFDPSRMSIPLTFDAWGAAADRGDPRPNNIEDRMDLLERMAGRGDFHGAARGTPALIDISVFDNDKHHVWLIPKNYQWTSDNDDAPLWRIVDLDWDDSPLRNTRGNRLRQNVVVTVEAYTTVTTVPRSVVKRTKGQGKKLTGKKDKPSKTSNKGRSAR